MRIWRVGSLRENFRVFVDDEGVVRCDHQVRFLGFNVLRLHYRIAVSYTHLTLPTIYSV